MRPPRLRTVLIGAGAAIALVAGTTTSYAAASAQPGSRGTASSTGLTYTGCVYTTSNRTLEKVYERTVLCPPGTFAISWNQQGQAGPQGPAGANVLTSPGVPTGACTTGDSDIDQANGEVYTCTASAWTDTGNSIKGPQGAPGQQGPSGVVSMTQLSGATPANWVWEWISSQSSTSETFADTNTAVQVTGTVNVANTSLSQLSEASENLGICYQSADGPVTPVNVTDVAFLGANFYSQTIAGVVGNLNAGTYTVGLCVANTSNIKNVSDSAAFMTVQTASGVTYAGSKATPARRRGTH